MGKMGFSACVVGGNAKCFSCMPFGGQRFKEIARFKHATKVSCIVILHMGHCFKPLLLQHLHLSVQPSLCGICITESLIQMTLLK